MWHWATTPTHVWQILASDEDPETGNGSADLGLDHTPTIDAAAITPVTRCTGKRCRTVVSMACSVFVSATLPGWTVCM
ncbi:hypothetical protein, partial [Cereibacter ovatus]|uniref:hypothetical protein n=1 Tax=Cereibacter ovatus TaxID=439529 RepID=UPI0019579AD8